jgi:hypothetical protein
VADGNKLTITALSGKYRGAYGGYCGSSRKDFERDMTKEEVQKSVYKFYWEREKRKWQRVPRAPAQPQGR